MCRDVRSFGRRHMATISVRSLFRRSTLRWRGLDSNHRFRVNGELSRRVSGGVVGAGVHGFEVTPSGGA